MRLSSLLLIWSDTAHTIESFESWGLGIAPIFSFPLSSHLQSETDLGFGVRGYIRKNERDFAAELGLETLSFEGTSHNQNSIYALGLYRPSYMDVMDLSVGAGAGYRDQDILKDSLFVRIRGMLEKDLTSHQTVGLVLDYDISTENPTTRDVKALITWTYYRKNNLLPFGNK